MVKKNKKVIFLTQYFYPDITATGQLLTELAIDLVKFGFDITVYTGQPIYATKEKMPKKEVYHGVKIIRVTTTRFDKNTRLGKVFNSLSFVILIFIKLFFTRNDAPLLIVSNPPFLPFIGWTLKKIKKQKYSFLVHDIYPDIAVKLGYISSNGIITRIWNKINNLIFANADQVICLGRDMKDIVEAKMNNLDHDIRIIPNWADAKEIKPLNKKDNWFIKEYNLENKFVVLYSGNHGLFHDLETIIEAAAILRNNKDILFLFIGNGGKKEKLIKMVEEKGLDNVKFLPYQPKANIPYSLTSADVSLVTLEKGVEGLAVPSKFYSALAIGKPIITLMDEKGEVARVIKEFNCGFNLTQGDTEGLANIILKLYKEPELVDELGRNARQCFEKNFTREKIAREYYDALSSLIKI